MFLFFLLNQIYLVCYLVYLLFESDYTFYLLYKKNNMLFTSRNLKLGTLRQNNSDSKDSKGSKSSQIVNKK